MPRFTTAQVRRYYNRQTAGFLKFGQGGSVGAIHRAVWGPGTVDRSQAFRYVEDQIAGFIGRLPRPEQRPEQPSEQALHVVDLGCGVAASLCYMAQQLPIRGTGITLSPVQVELARKYIASRGLTDRVVCREGDYCALPPNLGPADFAYAVESFLHCPDAVCFFAECARLIRPGGLLAICDDFLRPTEDPAAARTLEQFRRGWHVNALLQRDELQSLARAAGFQHESTVDLSPYLEIHRKRDRAIDLFLAIFGWLNLENTPFGHLVGGSALQTCLERKWIGYDLALFRRAGG